MRTSSCGFDVTRPTGWRPAATRRDRLRPPTGPVASSEASPRSMTPSVKWAKTIFGPDERCVFSDTVVPAGARRPAVETVATAAGPSGTMIGPSAPADLQPLHRLDRTSPTRYEAGWIKFMPSYFDGSTPFGTAWGTHIHWQVAGVRPDSSRGTEERHDYVVVVLDRPMGELTGWMGSRTYDLRCGRWHLLEPRSSYPQERLGRQPADRSRATDQPRRGRHAASDRSR